MPSPPDVGHHSKTTQTRNNRLASSVVNRLSADNSPLGCVVRFDSDLRFPQLDNRTRTPLDNVTQRLIVLYQPPEAIQRPGWR